MNHSHESAKKKTSEAPAGTVHFKTNCSWDGERETDPDGKVIAAAFNLTAGKTRPLPRATAEAREAAGLGEIVEHAIEE